MTSGHPGSAYEPRPDAAAHLAEWRRLAPTGKPVNEIAAAIGITRAALDRAVCRARAAGHPDAIYHPDAHLPGTGTWHITGRGPRRTRRFQEHR